MRLITFAAAALCAFALLWAWLITKIRYRISARHLRITLFGVTLRKIDLTDIKRISKRKPSSRACENWSCTHQPKHRVLAIQRRKGLRKFVIITPLNRYIFITDLQTAIQRVKPTTQPDNLVDPSIDEAPEEAEA
jgi:hypothetical protein